MAYCRRSSAASCRRALSASSRSLSAALAPRSLPPRAVSLVASRLISSSPRPATANVALPHTHQHQQPSASPPPPPSNRPYENRTTAELINSLLVFRLCGMPWLVKSSGDLLELAEKLRLDPIAYAVVKRTFFKHFCGGENLEEVVPTMQTFKKAHVGSILDLALEADVDEASLTGPAAHEQCKKVAQMFRDSIDIASQTHGSFIAVKITALLPVSILLSWSNTILLLQKAFDDAKPDKLVPNTPDNPLVTVEDLDTVKLLRPDIDGVGQHAKEKKVRIMVDAEQTYFQPAIDDVGLNLCKLFNNPIADGVANDPNTVNGPLIYNTYQLYLRDAYPRMVMDVIRAQRNKYAFGVKIVRGAYMHSERERATEIGISDPIQPTISATHAAYNAAIDHLIEKIEPGRPERPLAFVVASHNANSIRHAREEMKKRGIPPTERAVAFAQLMGMQDGTTHGLAAAGHQVFKYIPYGPIAVTIPYLQRRALENADVLSGEGGIAQDRAEIRKELALRFGRSPPPAATA
ncbi:FAD-linked oxidoreductase-like protein [Geranomyces variabilis]|nr:FAD-linked oxidoreductase-like protein [Geranomyces variabilis]